MAYAPMNPADIMAISNNYPFPAKLFPAVLGFSGSGTID